MNSQAVRSWLVSVIFVVYVIAIVIFIIFFSLCPYLSTEKKVIGLQCSIISFFKISCFFIS